MKRFALRDLVSWKDSRRRKPLVVHGARQVGKTWLIKEFGRAHFSNMAYVSFDRSPELAEQFERGYDTQRLISMISAYTHESIVPGETLIVLDEIQECPRALTSLKYFNEDAADYAVIAAGSLLGLTIHTGTGYPVGKVSTLAMYPMSFREFLLAAGEGPLLDILNAGDWPVLGSLRTKLDTYLKQYYFIGGMPEAVLEFVDSGDYGAVRDVQRTILDGYALDMSKHLSPRETEFALAAWDSIPRHLGKENKRFVFGQIADGARAKNYKSAITWLTQAGLATRVKRISKPGVPLSAYADMSAFKLFLVDVGLLGAMSKLDSASIAKGNSVFTEFRGALTEQYVCQQLVSDCLLDPFYWSAENSRGEIDFIVQDAGRIYPIEVKAEENLQAKSLRVFNERYEGMHCRRFSLSGFRDQDWMENIPLWAIGAKDNWFAETEELVH